MPTTRAMRLSTASSAAAAVTSPKLPKVQKRKSHDSTSDGKEGSSSLSSKKQRVVSPLPDIQSAPVTAETVFLPAVLSFSIEEAKQHLINADSRFRGIFNRLPCRPFEELERVDPFRTLASSILGQQISWMAARSIRHRFIRLYYPSLPEKAPADDSDAAKELKDIFPTANQVADADIATLKTAGLSTRKAEYIKDLASRFADGRLTNKKLTDANDEELVELLTEVRGIGKWTVDMFAIFSLRRPDILPVGDLGVQRGILRWFLSLHSPSDAVTVSPKKLPNSKAADSSTEEIAVDNTIVTEKREIDTPVPPATPVKGEHKAAPTTQSSPAEAYDNEGLPKLPAPFTPSINKILNPNNIIADPKAVDQHEGDKKPPLPLPDSLTVAVLRSRLNGKKKTKGQFLTPAEMEELTEPWRPYRSLGVYCMWALIDEAKTGSK